MAAYSTGASWSFPEDLPGGFKQEEDHDSPMEPLEDFQQQQDTYEPKQEPASPPPAQDEAKPHPRRRRHYPARTCRICLEVVEPTFHQDTSSLPSPLKSEPRVTYESADGGRLLRPCKCKGSQKYVHEECLGAWRMADPLQKRNYYECPTCRYRYQLQRLTWSSWISSTSAQIGLTVGIFVVTMFVLGFFADPIINLYLDPVTAVAEGGGPTGSLIFEDEDPGWAEHFAKGLASLGLLGFAKFLFGLGPWYWFNRNPMLGRSGGGNGRNRARELSWIAVAIGVATFLYAIWKGVRAWSRRTLEKAGERVMDVPGSTDDDDDE
ncbi:hypothetical protein MBLNU13_g01694t1 [Cladosporium sp. NU13]